MSCIFCAIADGQIPARILASDPSGIAFLDQTPKHAGHTLVIPRRHVADLNEDSSALIDIAPLISQVHDQLICKLSAAGANLLINSGQAAGQEVSHLHVHIVPRYTTEPQFDLDEVFARVNCN